LEGGDFKGKKAGDIDIHKEMSVERKLARINELEENRAAEVEAMKERKMAAQESLAVMEERNVAMDEMIHLM
jgi:hypothetical protein